MIDILQLEAMIDILQLAVLVVAPTGFVYAALRGLPRGVKIRRTR